MKEDNSPISDQAAGEHIDIVFDQVAVDGAPPEYSFIEVENSQRASIKFGEWVHRDDGYWVLRISTAPTTGTSPETDDTFITGYKVGAKLCGTVADAQRAIIQGHGSSWEPLYRKSPPKSVNPIASTLKGKMPECTEPNGCSSGGCTKPFCPGFKASVNTTTGSAPVAINEAMAACKKWCSSTYESGDTPSIPGAWVAALEWVAASRSASVPTELIAKLCADHLGCPLNPNVSAFAEALLAASIDGDRT